MPSVFIKGTCSRWNTSGAAELQRNVKTSRRQIQKPTQLSLEEKQLENMNAYIDKAVKVLL